MQDSAEYRVVDRKKFAVILVVLLSIVSVGVWVSLFLLPAGWYWVLFGFALFRFFDILKPWPVNWLDQRLAGGWGIMLDDVAAGLYSLAIIQALAYGLALR